MQVAIIGGGICALAAMPRSLRLSASDAGARADALANAVRTHADPRDALRVYETARSGPAAKVVRTNRAHPPDCININIKIEELVGDRPFGRLEDDITQDELRDLSESDERIAGFSLADVAPKDMMPKDVAPKSAPNGTSV